MLRRLLNRVPCDVRGRASRMRGSNPKSICAALAVMGAVAICVALSAIAAAASEASIAGHVIVTKALTKKRVTMPSYQLRGATLGSQDAQKYSSGAGEVDELSRVVIYLEGAGLHPGAPTQAKLAQKNRQFEPSIVVVPVGSTVSFPNADVIFHNVFSLSKAKPFDLGFYPAGETRSVRFDRPGIVQVYCHLHADMSAAILVLPNSSWTRPGLDGSFSLSGVPDGDYQLIAWHRSAGFFRRRITVSGGETPKVEFVIPVRDMDSGGAPAARSSR